MHIVGRLANDELEVPRLYGRHSRGFRRQSIVDQRRGSIHTGLGQCELTADGTVDAHVHSFEESFYVLAGNPQLTMQGETLEFAPNDCGLIPVGVPHGWSNAGETPARWLDMLAPLPREDEDQPPDTFFLDEDLVSSPARTLDLRDPRNLHFFRLDDGAMKVSVVQQGSRQDAPTVSASMATALLAYSGIAVKMLVDDRLGAQLQTMFMVEYQVGAVAHPHDHPFEETYVMLEGECDFELDGRAYTLRAGDVGWAGVGCIHAAWNRSGTTCRWLETQSPRPPERYSYRFNRDWDYLQDRLDLIRHRAR